MEEENLVNSLTDITDALLQSSQRESWTSGDLHFINGGQDVVMSCDKEMHINLTNEADKISLSPKAEQLTPEKAEEWEQMIWPMHSITCTSPSFSFATVQWDLHDASAETTLLMTDSSSANELHSRDVMSPDCTSPSLSQPQDVAAEFFQQDTEVNVAFDSQLRNSDDISIGTYSETCDVADVNELKTKEKEDSACELSDSVNEVTQTTNSKEDEELLLKESDNSFKVFELVEVSSGDVDACSDENLKEEQDEVCNVLTGQEEIKGDPTSVNDVKTEVDDKNETEEEEEQPFTDVPTNDESENVGIADSLTDLKAPGELLQLDSEPKPFAEEPIDPQEPELLSDCVLKEAEEYLASTELLREDLTALSEDVNMYEDVENKVELNQLDTADNNEETLLHEAENEAKTEDSQEVELTENLVEANDLEASLNKMASLQPESVEITKKLEQIDVEELDQLGQLEEKQPKEDMARPEKSEQLKEVFQTEQTGIQQHGEFSEKDEQTQPFADPSLPALSEPPIPTESMSESEIGEQMPSSSALKRQQKQAADLQPGEKDELRVVANGKQHNAIDAVENCMNKEVDRQAACRLAERLFKLDGIQRADVVKHIDKNNDFSHAVGEEYLKFFDFTGQTLVQALRSFLNVVVLIGETQERERVLQHFSCRFHQCNSDAFITSGAVLALTCALMLLNTDLHGQNVGKPMSCSKFVSNLDGMNEGENFSKDLLKSIYNSIKNDALEWAIDEEELKSSVLVEEDHASDGHPRSKANPFLDVPHDKKATVIKQSFLQRKVLADIDGKRTPWGKRSWKTFYGALKGMVLYLQKDNYERTPQSNEDVVSVHHSLAEQAADYTKKPHVFRLQTADWRVFLFQASSKAEMNSWISRINLVSALHSSPPFPAAVGSQRRFCRPILPASQTVNTLDRQLQSHSGMLESFKTDLLNQQQTPSEGKKLKAKDLEDHRVRTEYLHHEVCRYEVYIQLLEAWKTVKKTDVDQLSQADLNAFDKAVCTDSVQDEEDEGGLKKSYSSPSLELEAAPSTVKVRRNISERRTYRRAITPRLNKET